MCADAKYMNVVSVYGMCGDIHTYTHICKYIYIYIYIYATLECLYDGRSVGTCSLHAL